MTTRWTAEMDAVLTDLRAQGVGSKGIADQINARFATHLSRNAIIGRANRMKIKTANPPGPSLQNTRAQDERWLSLLRRPTRAARWQVNHLCRIMAEDLMSSDEDHSTITAAYAALFATTASRMTDLGATR